GVPFAFWQGALALPAGMSEAMIAGWRAEVVSVWPRLADESVFSEALLDCQLMCVWQQTHRELPGLAASVNGAQASSRPAALVSWWQELSKQAAFAGAADLADHAGAVAAGLDARFGPGLEFAPSPAFASGGRSGLVDGPARSRRGLQDELATVHPAREEPAPRDLAPARP